MTAKAPNWRAQAACATADPEIFFPPPNGKSTKAKAVCRGCPARLPCLEFVLDHPAETGVWAGFSEWDRRHHVSTQHQAGVPAADIIAADYADFRVRLAKLTASTEASAERKRARAREFA